MINKETLLQIYTLTLSEVKARYRNTVAGVVWVMFNPILMFLVHSLVFKHILKLDIERYFVFLLSGLLPWIFISSTIQQTSSLFITKRELLLSFQISPLSVLASKIIDNFINFIAPFFFILLTLSFFEDFNQIGILSLLACFPLIILMTFSISIIIATLQVFLRDVEYVTQFCLSIMFFLTPIFYPESLIPEKFKFIVAINPFFAVIKPFQSALWNFHFETFIFSLGKGFLFSITLFVISLFLWKKSQNEIYLYI